MVRTLLRSAFFFAAGVAFNGTAYIMVVLVVFFSPCRMLDVLRCRKVSYDFYDASYNLLTTPVVPLYTLLSGAASVDSIHQQGGLILRLIVLNSLVWGLLALGSAVLLRRIARRNGTAPATLSRYDPLDWPVIPTSLVIGLSLTVLSFGHITPAWCVTQYCTGAELKAGFPLMAVRDDTASSPPNGWGSFGMEDILMISVRGLAVNLIVYSGLSWLLWSSACWIIQRRERFQELAEP